MKMVAAVVVAVGLSAVALPVLAVVVLLGVGRGGAAPAAGATVGAAVAPPGAGATAAVAFALAELGKPYLWGGAGPDAFDCSGLTLRAWQAGGVTLPRVAADQYRAGAHVPAADAQPGDLVFFADDPADPATIVHVGIAIGAGRMVDAPFTGAVVRIDLASGPGLVPLATRPG